ncbi:hypothetical protein B1742_10485 [Enterobacter kobei]|nr:hypothetical protein B1742_10485 [Enterobacter kobei]
MQAISGRVLNRNKQNRNPSNTRRLQRNSNQPNRLHHQKITARGISAFSVPRMPPKRLRLQVWQQQGPRLQQGSPLMQQLRPDTQQCRKLEEIFRRLVAG